MKKVKVLAVNSYEILFDNNIKLYSEHDQDCCEHHYLDISHVSLDDFEGLEFDLSDENFFERIGGYGIALKPINGFPVRIPGYGSNNGYYSSNLTLIVTDEKEIHNRYDISECQDIDY